MNLTEVNVSLVNVDKMNEDLNVMCTEYMEKQGKDVSNLTYGIRSNKLGFVTSGNGNHIMVDTELIGDLIEDKYEIEIYETRWEDGKVKGFGMFPILNTGINLKELKEKYIGETTENVVEFMGTRYDYNSRIKSNQREFKNWLNERK